MSSKPGGKGIPMIWELDSGLSLAAVCESTLSTGLEWTQIDRPRVPEFSVAFESVE